MGYIRYRKSVNDHRHLRRTLAAAYTAGALTGVSMGPLTRNRSRTLGAKVRPLHPSPCSQFLQGSHAVTVIVRPPFRICLQGIGSGRVETFTSAEPPMIFFCGRVPR